MSMTDEQKSYLLAEYDYLTKQIHWRITQIVADQRNGLILTGALWAWLATNDSNQIFEFVKWAPVAIVILFSIKRVSMSLAIREQRLYLKTLEDKFNLPEGTGWVRTRKATPRLGKALRIWSILYWVSLLVANTALALLTTQP